MILQELVKFYDRLSMDDDCKIWEPGFSQEGIHYAIIIDSSGRFLNIEDLRNPGKDGKPHASQIVAPKRDGKRAGKVEKPYFLWDNTKYVLGKEIKNKKVKNFASHAKKFIEFNKEVIGRTHLVDSRVDSVISLLENQEELKKIFQHDKWELMVKDNPTGCNVTFKVAGDTFPGFIIEHESVKEAWRTYLKILDQEIQEQLCLVSGEYGPVYNVHPTIKKGVGGDKVDIPLVSFNIKCSESYKNKGNFNAPVQREVAAKFTHALNYLTIYDRHNLRIGDTKTLFWAEENDTFSDYFGEMFERSQNDGYSAELSAFLKSIRSGNKPREIDHDNSRFFVLGLAPNSARISVRFWHVDSVEAMACKIGKHFEHLSIIPQNKDKDSEFPSIWQIVIETATQHKTENIPANILGPLMRSILTGTHYPANILSILVSRMRTDQGFKQLNYYRASFMKAILNRNFNRRLNMSLDPTRTTIPYCLGRLFAALEKTQEDASGGTINATIRDRYFASASARPKVVFALILRLAQNHLKKMKSERPGKAVNREKLLGEIMGTIHDFPATLKLEEQGEFAIGYYHQRQDFFVSKHDKSEN